MAEGRVPVTGENRPRSGCVDDTWFGLDVGDREGAFATLSLTGIGEDHDGELTVAAERLPEDLHTVGDTGYVSVYLEFDEESTPDDAKPAEWN